MIILHKAYFTLHGYARVFQFLVIILGMQVTLEPVDFTECIFNAFPILILELPVFVFGDQVLGLEGSQFPVILLQEFILQGFR